MAQRTTIVLLSGDYPQRLLKAAEAAIAARSDQGDDLMMSERHPAEILAEEYEALRVEAKEAGTRVILEAVGRKAWRALKAKHPARIEGDAEIIKGDRLAGLNAETVEDDLLHASLLEPTAQACARDQRLKDEACSDVNPCTQRASFDDWADALTEGEFQQVLIKAWSLSLSAVMDPKALPHWQIQDGAES